MRGGQVAPCDFCESESAPTIELGELADRVHSVIEEHFQATSPYPEGIELLAAREGHWVQSGEPVRDVIWDLINSPEAVADAIWEDLSEKHDPRGKDAAIDPGPYDSEAHYEERGIDTYEFAESWRSFKENISGRARFFNRFAEETLSHLFSGISELETHDGQPVVQQLAPENVFFRARVALSDEKLKSILQNLPGSLGVPPHGSARAGRMNPEGIGMVYGAMDAETCLAEVRAPVGSQVVIGRFSPVRQMRLLDLSLLQDVYLYGSLFDAEYTQALSRLYFLKSLVWELSAPVMPGTEGREYLPTQVVAEFLAAQKDMALDGVLFASSQVAGLEGSDDESDLGDGVTEKESRPIAGKNIVLFPHACIHEAHELPIGTKVDVSLGRGDPDDSDDDISVTERVPVEGNETEIGRRPSDIFDPFDTFAVMEEVPSFDPSIRLDLEGVFVLDVLGVGYRTTKRAVDRFRYEVRPGDPLDF